MTLASDPAESKGPVQGRHYLAIFGLNPAKLVPLPDSGVLYVGIDDLGSLVFEEYESPFSCVIFTLERDGVFCAPKSRECFLRVNRIQIFDSTKVALGASVDVGNYTLVLQRDSVATDQSLTESGRIEAARVETHRRLKEELERAVRYRRSLSILVIDVSDDLENGVGTDAMHEAIVGAVRTVDVLDSPWDGRFILLFPETDENAEVPARRCLDKLSVVAPYARGGLARCPDDGTRIDDLLRKAEGALAEAATGDFASVSTSITSLNIADQLIVAADSRMKHVFKLVRDLARSDMPTLITGETGVGKEIIATALHEWSPRAKGKLVAVNCAAFAESLLESELFGHERGAFSGAIKKKIGLLESANNGTVFLDEISEATPHVQAELLRVLETKKIRPIGSVDEHEIDVRIVAATNRNLQTEISTRKFRRDLYYRLGAAKVHIPPLRERIDDLPYLASLFLEKGCRGLGRESMEISPKAIEMLSRHKWPGNIRELKNLMEYVAAVVYGSVLKVEHLPQEFLSRSVAPSLVYEGSPIDDVSPTGRFIRPLVEGQEQSPVRFRKLSDEIKELERTRIRQALAASNGVRAQAAKLIGMPLRTLVSKIKTYGLSSVPSAARRSPRDKMIRDD